MQIDITPVKAEGLERLLEVSVPLPEVQRGRGSRGQALRERRCGSRASVPARRPREWCGRSSPRPFARKRSRGSCRRRSRKCIDREKLDLATQPHIHDLKAEDGQPLTFQLHLEIRPSIELPAHRRASRVTRTSKPVSDEQLREQVETLRDQRATWAPVSERPLPGDMVTVQLATAEDDGTHARGQGVSPRARRRTGDSGNRGADHGDGARRSRPSVP